MEVRDTGIGIAEDQLQRIFEPFVQVGRSLTSTRQGAGLGLAISRDLARAMDGEINVKSSVTLARRSPCSSHGRITSSGRGERERREVPESATCQRARSPREREVPESAEFQRALSPEGRWVPNSAECE